MIKIIAGGKKHVDWCGEACAEYEKRLRKPYTISWQFMEEKKLDQHLTNWPFSRDTFVVCCDERGEMLSSVDLSGVLDDSFINGKDVVILIGGAYGFSEDVRRKSNLVWSFSRLVFPHMIARLIVAEQIYRSQEIAFGRPYHHE